MEGAAGEELDLDVRSGWIESGLAGEFPGLSIIGTSVEATTGRSPRALKARMRMISDRIRGAQALQVRTEPIPWAYRVFFRHIGLDPDVNRTPIEDLIFRRIYEGGLYSNRRVDDALTVAILEVGVALQVFDADRIEGEVGLRRSSEGEGFEGRTAPLPPGTIVIADEQWPVGILFGSTAEGREPGKRTTRMLLVAIGVSGVPDIALEEGLWVAASGLRA